MARPSSCPRLPVAERILSRCVRPLRLLPRRSQATAQTRASGASGAAPTVRERTRSTCGPSRCHPTPAHRDGSRARPRHDCKRCARPQLVAAAASVGTPQLTPARHARCIAHPCRGSTTSLWTWRRPRPPRRPTHWHTPQSTSASTSGCRSPRAPLPSTSMSPPPPPPQRRVRWCRTEAGLTLMSPSRATRAQSVRPSRCQPLPLARSRPSTHTTSRRRPKRAQPASRSRTRRTAKRASNTIRDGRFE
mmetsp:Transcript_8015/g.24994  ORF Transcript_8015/g.24994 Transcript_8015/m.24994 type:complete len:248 (+) Transcript_8015:147-890(+)